MKPNISSDIADAPSHIGSLHAEAQKYSPGRQAWPSRQKLFWQIKFIIICNLFPHELNLLVFGSFLFYCMPCVNRRYNGGGSCTTARKQLGWLWTIQLHLPYNVTVDLDLKMVAWPKLSSQVLVTYIFACSYFSICIVVVVVQPECWSIRWLHKCTAVYNPSYGKCVAITKLRDVHSSGPFWTENKWCWGNWSWSLEAILAGVNCNEFFRIMEYPKWTAMGTSYHLSWFSACSSTFLLQYL